MPTNLEIHIRIYRIQGTRMPGYRRFLVTGNFPTYRGKRLS